MKRFLSVFPVLLITVQLLYTVYADESAAQLVNLMTLYESDTKYNEYYESIFNEDFNDEDTWESSFSYKRYIALDNIDAAYGGSLKLTPGTDKSALASYTFPEPLCDGVYHMEFDTLITSEASCYNYVDFSDSTGSGFNSYVVMPRASGNAKIGFYHTKRQWSQSVYNTEIVPGEWAHVDMLLDLDKGYTTYYINGRKLSACRYDTLDSASLTGFSLIRSGSRDISDGGSVYYDNIIIEKVCGEEAYRLRSIGLDIEERVLCKPVRLEIVSDSPGNILFGNSSFGIVGYNRSDTALTANITMTVSDVKGDTVLQTDVGAKSFPSKEKTAICVDFSDLDYGLYKLTVTADVSDGSVTYAAADFSVCVDASGVRNSKLGINNHLSRTTDFDINSGDVANIGTLMARAGFGWSRGGLDGQNFTKDSEGNYVSFTEDTERQNAYESATIGNNIQVMQLLSHNAQNAFEAYPPTTDAEIENYAEYASDLVAEYKDKVKYWEVWNEYNLASFNSNLSSPAADEEKAAAAQSYAKLLKAVYTAAKEADEDCKIVAFSAAVGQSSLAWKGIDFIEAVLTADPTVKDYFDVCSYHYYNSVNTNGETSGFADTMSRLRRVLDENGCEDKPIWITETGFTTGNYVNETSSIGVDINNQPGYIIKTLLTSDAHGFADNIMLYVLTDKWRSDVYENGFGILNGIKGDSIPFSAKPSYLAIANWNRLFTNAQFRELLYDSTGRCLAYRYTSSEGDGLAALYNSDIGVRNVSVYLGCSTAALVDIYGNEKVLSSADGTYDLSLTDEIVYLKGNFTALKFTDEYEGGYVKTFEDDFENYTGGNREFFRNINTAMPYSYSEGIALSVSDSMASSSLTRRVFLRDNLFSGSDKVKLTFKIMMPNEPESYLSQTYFRLRNDSAAASADTAELKNKTWLMFMGITDGKIHLYKKAGAYLTTEQSAASLNWSSETWYNVTLEIDFENSSVYVKISDGANEIENTVTGISLEAFDCLEFVTVKPEEQYISAYCIDDICAYKYIDATAADWIVRLKDENGEAVESIKSASGNTITVSADIINEDLLVSPDLTVYAVMYDGSKLFDVKKFDVIQTDNVTLNLPDDRENAKIKAFLWSDMVPLAASKRFR
ncbi:MAG: hypothetical protein ACI4DY_02955 [Monoglobaceae bacterium]